MNKKLQTPPGVSDVLENDCLLKREIESKVSKAFDSFGYNEIQTPTFEYFSVFGDDLSLPPEKVIKFIDSTGHIAALRPDITTAISRVAATHCGDAARPIRLRYLGNAFRLGESYHGARQQEFTQAGVELFGVSDPASDAEVLIVTIDALLACGLDEFQIEVGHVDFLRGVVGDALSAEELDALKTLLDKKFILGVEDFCDAHALSGVNREILCEMPSLFGGVEILTQMLERPLSARSRGALDNLIAVHEILCEYGYDQYVSFDLGLVRSFQYYTGIIFKGITHGVAFPICGGGRYDTLCSRFDVDLPATGVAIWIDRVMSARYHQKQPLCTPKIDVRILCTPARRAEAFKKAKELRAQGKRVICECSDSRTDAAEVLTYE